jgi:bacillithiol biosynthesis cysteine-adding enzyme BshC
MFKITHLNLRQAGTLNPLMQDYIERNKKTSPYYTFFPDKTGFSELLKTNPYAGFNRKTLAEILLRQSRQVENTSESSVAAIAKLEVPNTYTVTTGHQLCLFTGPLYFIYKIFSVINLARDLKAEFPDKDFVPVYWMASEDHDFEEIASFYVEEKTIRWKSDQKGAVGNFKTQELKALLPELSMALGLSENSKYLLELFETAYLKHPNLSQATRYLVNALFGEYGLVCVDGDDASFKQQFKSYFAKDLFENATQQHVNKSIAGLEALGYSIQVNPRPINCFYLDEQQRLRIEKNGELYQLVGTDRSFTKKELEALIDAQPERLSPNVVLRPVYQQVILPNIAYVGGPGELAYWLEFKTMFESFGVFFPVLMPRNFITVINRASRKNIEKLKLSEQDVFKSEEELIHQYLVEANSVFDLKKEETLLEAEYLKIAERSKSIDPTLERHVLAARQRALNQLKVVEQKTNRALKKREQTTIRQIEAVKQHLFPKGVPQERYDNFAAFYLNYGPGFFKAIQKAIDPFALDHKILVEK